MLKEKLMNVIHGQEGGAKINALLATVAGSSLLLAVSPWDFGNPPAGESPLAPTPASAPGLTIEQILARLGPIKPPTPISMRIQDASPTAISDNEPNEPPFYDEPALQAAGPAYNPSSLHNTFFRSGVPECQVGLVREIDAWQRLLHGLLPVKVAEAAELDKADTKEEFLKCIRAINDKRPFSGLLGIDVKNLTPDQVMGVKSIAEWQSNLVADLKGRGFNVSQDQVNSLFASRLFFVAPDKTLGQIQPIVLNDKAEVDRRRAAGERTVYWSGELAWGGLVDEGKGAAKVFFVYDECRNPLVRILQIQPEQPAATATSTPTATATGTITPTPTATSIPETSTATATATSIPPTETPTATSIPETSTATATATSIPPTETPSPPATPTPTRTPIPINTHVPMATATRVPENTPTPTRTPIPINTHVPMATATRVPENTPTPTRTPIPPVPTATRAVPTPIPASRLSEATLWGTGPMLVEFKNGPIAILPEFTAELY